MSIFQNDPGQLKKILLLLIIGLQIEILRLNRDVARLNSEADLYEQNVSATLVSRAGSNLIQQLVADITQVSTQNPKVRQIMSESGFTNNLQTVDTLEKKQTP
jgi:hypothetical protein